MLTKKLLLSIIALTLSCSYFRFDPDENCNNPNSDCFKADTTAPYIVSTMPPANETVSTLSEIIFVFSEELRDVTNIDNYIISGTGAAGLTPVSIDSLGNYTYRLNFSGLVQNGPIQFNVVLTDYNSHSLVTPQFALVGNVELEIIFSDITHDYLSASAGAYTSTDISWNHDYTLASVGSVNHYSVRLRASSCTTGVEFASGNDLAGQTTVVTTIPVENLLPGTNSFFVCVDNQVDNKAGHSFTNLFRDDSPPASSIAPDAGAYPVQQNIEFTCEDNCDRIIYTTDGSDPSFNPDGTVAAGEVLSGTSWITPYTADPTITNLKWTAIDRSGNTEGVVHSAEYYIDSRFPLLTIQSIEYTRLSATGSRNTTDIVWSSSDDGTYSVRLNSCLGAQITGVVNGSGNLTADQSIVTTIPATGLLDGLNRVYFCSTRTDTAMQGYTAVNLNRDDSAPDVTVTATGANPTNEPDIYFTIIFTEPVVNFLPEAITVSNGTVADLSGSGASYTARVTPFTDGTVSLSIVEGAVEDPSGNGNTLSNTASVLYDATPPDVTLSSSVVSPTNQSEVQITVQINESVTGLTMNSFVLINATAQSLMISGTDFILTLSPTTDGTVSVYLPEGAVYDAANNRNTASNTIEFVYDVTLPTVAIDTPSYINRINQTAYAISGTCSEEGQTVSVIAGGIVSTSAACMSNTFTAVMDLSSIADGPSVIITADHMDEAGNSAPQSIVTTVKSTGLLSVTINPPPAVNSSNQSAYTVSGTCTEEGRIVSVIADGITTESECSSLAYSVEFNLTGVSDTLALIITADHTDEAGNFATQAGVTVVKDTSAPSAPAGLALAAEDDTGWSNTDGVTNKTSGLTILGTSEPLASIKLTTAGVELGNTTANATGIWTVDISLPEGTTALVASASDAAGNTGPDSAPLNITIDATAPTVDVTTFDPHTNLTPITVTITFNEPVNGLEASDFVLSSGTVLGITETTPGTVWTALIEPAVIDNSSETITVTLNADAATDRAGNGNPSKSLTIYYDSKAPDFAGIESVTRGGTTVGTELTITWTEATDDHEIVYEICESVNPVGCAASWVTSYTTGYLSYVVTSKDPDIIYYYQVRAVDSLGNFTQSQEVASAYKLTVDASSDTTDSGVVYLSLNGGPAETLTAAGQTGSLVFATILGFEEQYSVAITGYSEGVVFAFPEKQYGSMPACDLNLSVKYLKGYMVAGRYQELKSAPLNYHLYQGRANSLLEGTNKPNSLVCIGDFLYFGDYTNGDIDGLCLDNNCRIMKVSTLNGAPEIVVSTLPGVVRSIATDGTNLFYTMYGDNGVWRTDPTGITLFNIATLVEPGSLTIHNGNIYAVEKSMNRIRRINLSTGTVHDVANINTPGSIAVAGSYIYITAGHAIYRVPSGGGTPELLFGNHSTPGFVDGTGTAPRFNQPMDIVFDGHNSLFVAENVGNRIRLVNLNTNFVSTIAGNGIAGQFSSDMVGIQAQIPGPVGITTDGRNLYISYHQAGSGIAKISDNGLVGYWPLNGTPLDYSGVQDFRNATNYDTITSAGRYNNSAGSAYFNGSSSYLSASSGTAWPIGDASRTFSAWINPADLPGQNNFMCLFQYSTGSQKTGIYIYNDGVQKSQIVLAGGSSNLFASYNLPINKWSHICAVYDANISTAKIYLNGKNIGQFSNFSSNAIFDDLYIGKENTNTSYYNGYMSDVRIYNRPLGESEVNFLAQDADPGLVGASYNKGPLGLLSHYHFTEQSTIPSLSDSGPLGIDLDNFSNTDAATGKDGDLRGAYKYFPLTSNYLYSNDTIGMPSGSHPRTISLWINPDKYPDNNRQFTIFHYGTPGALSDLAITIANEEGAIKFIIEASPSPGYKGLVGYKPPLNTWTHICVLYYEDMVTIYANGKYIEGGTLETLNTQPGALYIGRNLSEIDQDYFSGKIDEVRVYNNLLTSEQIRGLAVQVPDGLVAHYDFTDNPVAPDEQLKDVSGFGNHGTIKETASGNVIQAADRFGHEKSAYNFSGVLGNYLEASDINLPLGKTARTISLWYKKTGNGFGCPALYGPHEAYSHNGFCLGGENDVVYDGFNESVTSSISVKNNTWHFICGTFDGTTARLYVNGELVTDATATNNWNTLSSSLKMGSFRGDSGIYYAGDIDDLRVYNRVLSPEQIRALAAQPNKIIFVTATSSSSNLGGIAGADVKCMEDTNHPDYLKEIAFRRLFKAMLVAEDFSRRACTTNYCGDNGIKENIDWVLRPHITYTRSDLIWPIFTANSNSVWHFIDDGLFYNKIFDSPLPVMTGMYPDWKTYTDRTANSWTEQGSVVWKIIGNTDSTNQQVINYSNSNLSNHIYCVEQ